MSKADKNDIIYFKQACDRTYTTSNNVEQNGVVQQTMNGSNVYPKTKASAVVMSDGKTLEEAMQSGGAGSIIRIDDVTIMGSTSLNNTGTCYYGFSFSPSNYNVEIESVEVTSDCPEVVIGYANPTEFQVNVNTIPAATDHKFTVVVKDKIGMVVTKEFAYTIKQEPTSLSISGNASVDNESTNNYTINYSPSTYNVAPTSVEITANNSSVTISNKTKTGFTFKPILESTSSVVITVKATMPSGAVITNTKSVSVNCGPDYDAIDEYGVAIMDIKGRFYKKISDWDNAGNPTVNGIAISDGTHRFCVATSAIRPVCNTAGVADAEFWGAYNTQVSGVTTTSTSSVAMKDFNGIANTDAIVANVKTSDGHFTKSPWSAAGLCRQFTFPNGAKGYLGSCGEWGLVQNVVSEINEFMDEFGGAMIANGSTNQPVYWTSTQYGPTYAWYYNIYSDVIAGSNKYSNNLRVRAFCAI